MIPVDKAHFECELVRVFELNGIADLLDEEKTQKLFEFTQIMLEENQKYNLTSITDVDKIILLHYADSLIFCSEFEQGKTVIDVGCGAGFPSVPLAICRPDLRITALDSTAKRVNYVKSVSDKLGLDINAVCARAEDAARADKTDTLREKFDYSTARAVANLPVLCELCIPMTKIGGAFVAMKGKNGEEELKSSQNAIKTLGATVSRTKKTTLCDGLGEQQERTLAVISKTEKTKKEYPRAYAQICKKPL